MDTIYINLLTCSSKGRKGVFNGHEKPRDVEESLPRSLLGLEEWVMVGTSGRRVQYVQDLAVTQEPR